MLIERVVLRSSEKTETGYAADINIETADGFEFGGVINFDHDWNYDLGFLNTFVNTEDDKSFVDLVLRSDDFKNDILSYIVH